MKEEIQIRVKGSEIRYIYSDSLMGFQKLGDSEIKRASNVEPGDDGWYADMKNVNGPKLGPFETRQAALDKEVEWIYQNKISKPN